MPFSIMVRHVLSGIDLNHVFILNIFAGLTNSPIREAPDFGQLSPITQNQP